MHMEVADKEGEPGYGYYFLSVYFVPSSELSSDHLLLSPQRPRGGGMGGCATRDESRLLIIP